LAVLFVRVVLVGGPKETRLIPVEEFELAVLFVRVLLEDSDRLIPEEFEVAVLFEQVLRRGRLTCRNGEKSRTPHLSLCLTPGTSST
jgi:hypothetical protein